MMIMNILHIAVNSTTNTPFYIPTDIKNTQIIILNNHINSFYIDLWKMMAERLIVRLNEFPETIEFENIIVLLPNVNNPIWKRDWEIYNCG